jgi:hypothetical protein
MLMLSRMALFRVGIAAVVAAAGFAALSISSAALFVQSAEAESGAVAGQAAAAAESNASGGKAVRFGASALPGPSGGPYDAGLLTTLRLPDAVSGRTLLRQITLGLCRDGGFSINAVYPRPSRLIPHPPHYRSHRLKSPSF